jgi:Predicted pPIWI-associating nuclease
MICEGFPFQIASRWNTSTRSIHWPFRNAGLSFLELELRAKLIDDFSAQVLTGALAVLDVPSNPIRLNQFAAAMRELFGHTLHALAPDGNVTKCEWFEPEPRTKGPTRRQRAKYATQGGLSDDYIVEIGVDVQHLHDVAIKAIDDMSKYTHVRPGTIIDNPHEIAFFVDGAMHALLGLFASFAECRSGVLDALSKEIDDEAVDALITETI